MSSNPDPELKVRSFTVSYSFDAYRNGQKSNHFISMNFESVELLDLDDAAIAALKGSKLVTRTAIDTAIARGVVNIDEANQLLLISKTNHDNIIEHRTKKIKLTDS
jgi:hypothetical protein